MKTAGDGSSSAWKSLSMRAGKRQYFPRVINERKIRQPVWTAEEIGSPVHRRAKSQLQMIHIYKKCCFYFEKSRRSSYALLRPLHY